MSYTDVKNFRKHLDQCCAVCQPTDAAALRLCGKLRYDTVSLLHLQSVSCYAKVSSAAKLEDSLWHDH